LALHVLRGPEADDLEEPAASIAAVLQRKVRKDQDVAGFHGLRLTDDVPVRRNAPEVACEALLSPAVVEAWLLAWEDRVARPELEDQLLTPDSAVRPQPKPVTPREKRQHLTQ